MTIPATDPVTGDTLTQYLNKRLAALKLDRSSYVSHWQTIADNMSVRAVRFQTSDKNQSGSKRNTKVINSTATFSLRTSSAGMMSGITAPSRPWFNLGIDDKAINEMHVVRMWLEDVETQIREAFRRSNLYTILPLVYDDLLTFGTSAFAVMEDEEDGIRCYPFPIGSYVLGVGHRGNVNICIREFKQSVGQLVSEFGLENCSTEVQRAYKEKRFDTQIECVQAIEENPDANDKLMESKYRPFRSVTYEVSASDGKVLSNKGMHEFPVMAPRWRVVGEDTWGNSPSMDVLGDVLQLQQMEKRKLQALEMLINPPRSAPAGMRNEYIGTLSGEITFVPDGQLGSKVEPNYVINPYLDHIRGEIQAVEQRIKHGLFEDLFLMISNDERSNITATEIQARQQEKMTALGPILERLNDEMLDPLVKRVYGILERNFKIAPIPTEMNSPIVIEYVSILAQAMKLQGVVGVERLVGFVGSVAAGRPDALDKLNMDATIDAYADMVGVPPALVNAQEVVDKARAQRAAMDQANQQMALVSQGADTAKVMSETDVSSPSMLQQMAGVIQQAGPQVGVQ